MNWHRRGEKGIYEDMRNGFLRHAALSVIMALPGCSYWNAVFFARMGLFFRRGTA